MGVPEGWTVVSLGDVITDPTGGVSVLSEDRSAGPDEPAVLKTSAVTYGVFRATENKLIRSDEIPRAREPLKGDHIVFSRMNTQALAGASAYVETGNNNLYLPDRLWQFAAKSERTANTRWLAQFLGAPHTRAQLSSLATGTSGSMKNISKQKLLGLRVLLAPIGEQRKIAAILSSVDEAIEKTQAVIDQVQVVKKGLMQELLTRGIPGRHEKFKQTEIGEIPASWEVAQLTEVCVFLDHLRVPIKASDRKSMNGDVPYYGASGVIDYVTDFIFDEDLILLSEDGANIITRSSPIAFKITGKAWVNNHAHVLRPLPGVDHDFLVEWLESLDYANYSTGTAQPKLNRNTCDRLPVALPSPSEQLAIGDIVRSLETRMTIELRSQKALSTLKQSLMSNLLTGQIRVTP